MSKNWEDIQELLGDTKVLKVQLVLGESGFSLRLIGNRNVRSFKIKKQSLHVIDLFDLKFQVPKNKKSPFRYQLPSVKLNLDSLEETKQTPQ